MGTAQACVIPQHQLIIPLARGQILDIDLATIAEDQNIARCRSDAPAL